MYYTSFSQCSARVVLINIYNFRSRSSSRNWYGISGLEHCKVHI